MRILLIEDDPICAIIAKQFFNNRGVEVIHNISAEKGIDSALDSTFDAIVTDIDLPGINGDQLADMISITDIEAPVFGLTANRDFCNEHRSMRDFYSKPINDRIVDKIIKSIN